MDIFDFNLTEEGEPAAVQPHEKKPASERRARPLWEQFGNFRGNRLGIKGKVRDDLGTAKF